MNPISCLRVPLLAVCAVLYLSWYAPTTAVALTAAAPGPGSDVIPRTDLDVVKTPANAATTARWLFRPQIATQSEAALGQGGTARVGTIQTLQGLWILEAPIDSVSAVENIWSQLGTLTADQSGTPALSRTTQLIGANPIVWNVLSMRGDGRSTVAILDSGCDTAHDDLGDVDLDNEDGGPQSGDADDWSDAETAGGFNTNLALRVAGWHDVTDDQPGSAGPYDYHLHGTALAGAGFGNGTTDPTLSGVAPEGRMVIVKTYNFEGQWMVWASDLLLGIDWVLANRNAYEIRTVLIGAVWEDDLGITDAVSALIDVGIVVVAPSGNDPTGPLGYPGRVDGVLTVGATDVEGRVASYSTRGDAGVPRLDLVAPGGSLDQEDGGVLVCDNEPNDTYRAREGTSIAAAHVAGAMSILAQAWTETGRVWQSTRAQVRQITDLLRITAWETAGLGQGTSPGVTPRLDRVGYDSLEGYGLVQLPAAVDAIRRVSWPGDRVTFFLFEPPLGPNVWAVRIPVAPDGVFQVELFPDEGLDLDLAVWREEPDGYVPVGMSLAAAPGQAEVVRLENPRRAWHILVVKRIAGQGSGILITSQEFQQNDLWPVRLSADASAPPTAFDLDGDGQLEVLTTNNVAIDPQGHTFYAVNADGSNFGIFPRTVFSSGLGVLSRPVVAASAQGPIIAAGSQFGEVLGMRSNGQLAFQTAVSNNEATTAAVVVRQGAADALAVASAGDVVVLDVAGSEIARWSASGPEVSALAVVDLDDDGQDELVYQESGALQVRSTSGTAFPGWPVALDAGRDYGAPVVLGQNGADHFIAIIERQTSGNSTLLVFDASGSVVTGFPAAFSTAGASTATASGFLIASRTERGGESYFLAGAVHAESSGGAQVRVHRFSLNGQESLWPLMPLASPGFVGSTFNFTRMALGEIRVGDVAADAGAELFLPLQAAWNEAGPIGTLRFGSMEGSYGFAGGELDARFRLDTLSGHVSNPKPGILAPLIADLDNDGRAEIVVARANQLYLLPGRQASVPEEFWNQDRADVRATGCYGCQASTPVAAENLDSPTALSYELSAHPNPFNPRVQFELYAPSTDRVQWSVYDARGRRVARWESQPVAGPAHRQTWAALDDHGRPLASGVYRVVADVEGRPVTTSVTLIR